MTRGILLCLRPNRSSPNLSLPKATVDVGVAMSEDMRTLFTSHRTHRPCQRTDPGPRC